MSKIIYTKHAENRIRLRRLNKTSIRQTIEDPDRTESLDDHKKKFIKLQGTRLYHVVANYVPRQKSWLVISVWVRGEEDPPNYLWLALTWPFRTAWKLFLWLLRLLFGW